MRFVPLDRHLLARAIDDERDGLTSEMCGGPLFADRVMHAASFGLSFAMLDGADVPVCGGILPHWPGKAEAWWLVSKHATRRQLVQAARASMDFLDRRQRDPSFRRVELFVRAGERWSLSFARSMGFVEEGYHSKWDAAGRDYRSFARVRG